MKLCNGWESLGELVRIPTSSFYVDVYARYKPV